MNVIETIVVECLPGASIVTEFRFAYPRRWRIDYAVFWNGRRIAIEVEGGAWIFGRHNRPTGFIKDIEKYNAASAEGWTLFRVLPGKEKELEKFLARYKEVCDADNGGGDYE